MKIIKIKIVGEEFLSKEDKKMLLYYIMHSYKIGKTLDIKPESIESLEKSFNINRTFDITEIYEFLGSGSNLNSLRVPGIFLDITFEGKTFIKNTKTLSEENLNNLFDIDFIVRKSLLYRISKTILDEEVYLLLNSKNESFLIPFNEQEEFLKHFFGNNYVFKHYKYD